MSMEDKLKRVSNILSSHYKTDIMMVLSECEDRNGFGITVLGENKYGICETCLEYFYDKPKMLLFVTASIMGDSRYRHYEKQLLMFLGATGIDIKYIRNLYLTKYVEGNIFTGKNKEEYLEKFKFANIIINVLNPIYYNIYKNDRDFIECKKAVINLISGITVDIDKLSYKYRFLVFLKNIISDLDKGEPINPGKSVLMGISNLLLNSNADLYNTRRYINESLRGTFEVRRIYKEDLSDYNKKIVVFVEPELDETGLLYSKFNIKYVDIVIDKNIGLDNIYDIYEFDDDFNSAIYNYMNHSKIYEKDERPKYHIDDVSSLLLHYIATNYNVIYNSSCVRTTEFIDALLNNDTIQLNKILSNSSNIPNILKPLYKELYDELKFPKASTIYKKWKELINTKIEISNKYNNIYDSLYEILSPYDPSYFYDDRMFKFISGLNELLQESNVSINNILIDDVSRLYVEIADTTSTRDYIIKLFKEEEIDIKHKISYNLVLPKDIGNLITPNINTPTKVISHIVDTMRINNDVQLLLMIIKLILDHKLDTHNLTAPLDRLMYAVSYLSKYSIVNYDKYKDKLNELDLDDESEFITDTLPAKSRLFLLYLFSKELQWEGIVRNFILSPLDLKSLKNLYNLTKLSGTITESANMKNGGVLKLKNKGLKVIENEYYQLALLTKNQKELDDIIYTLSKVNNRISMLSEYIEQHKLDMTDEELDSVNELLSNYMKLRIELSSKNTINRPKYSIWRVTDEEDDWV